MSWFGRSSTMSTSIPASASSPASISPVGPLAAVNTALVLGGVVSGGVVLDGQRGLRP